MRARSSSGEGGRALTTTWLTSLSGNVRSTWIAVSTVPATTRAPGLSWSALHRGADPSPSTARVHVTTSIGPVLPRIGTHRPSSATAPAGHARRGGGRGGRQPRRGASADTPLAREPFPSHSRIVSSSTSTPTVAAIALDSRWARHSPVARSRARPTSHGARGTHPAGVLTKRGPHPADAIADETHAPWRTKSGHSSDLPAAAGPRHAFSVASVSASSPIRPEHTRPT